MHAHADRTTPFERFRQAILADPALQQALDGTIDPDLFARRMRDTASALAMDLDADALAAHRRRAPVPAQSDWAPPGWLPAAMRESGGELVVDWAHFGRAPLTHSFYADSVAAARARPFNRAIRCATTLDGLVEGAHRHATTRVAGFIFHMSRCGSTLAAQLLGGLDATVSLAEPGPLDSVLRLAFARQERPAELLRAMIAALARPRNGERRCFIKLDSWHILLLPLIRAAYPDVPWIYLFREPLEVLVSQLRRRGYQTVPALVPAGLYGETPPPSEPAQECARILAVHHLAALEALDGGGGIAVDYATLHEAFETRVAPHFDVELSKAERRRLAARASRDAKAIDRPFVPDAAQKRAQADAGVRRAAGEHLGDLHTALLAAAR